MIVILGTLFAHQIRLKLFSYMKLEPENLTIRFYVMNSNRKKILVALDGSGHAFDTLGYLSQVLVPHRVELVLFSVLNREPERFWDTEEIPLLKSGLTDTGDWEIQQKKAIEEFMENALQLLTDRGFPVGAVMVKIQERKMGVARDIILEAQDGYDAVVTGRQGMNPITRLVIGSIASKLIGSLTHVPLWLVGKAVQNKRILVSIDASEGAMRAVEHVGSMVGGANLELTLFHVIRRLESKLPGKDEKFFEPVGKDDSTQEYKDELAIRAVFEKAYKVLEEAGFNQEQITTKIISGVATRSGSIVAQAMNGGYGTIVLGRRGHSKVGEFYMGRVTNKVIQLANKMAVWVVS